jgi:hypothetical protein
MTDKKKPWQKTLKDYLYKAVPSKIKKIKKLASSLKNIDMLDNPGKNLKKEGLKIDKTGKVRELPSLEGIKEGVKKAVADKKKVVEIKTGKPLTRKTKPKPKQKPKQKTKLKDKLITGAAGVASLGAGAGLYKSGEKMGEYKERQKMHDKDLESFRKKQKNLKEKSRDKKKPLNLNKKNRGVWV